MSGAARWETVGLSPTTGRSVHVCLLSSVAEWADSLWPVEPFSLALVLGGLARAQSSVSWLLEASTRPVVHAAFYGKESEEWHDALDVILQKRYAIGSPVVVTVWQVFDDEEGLADALWDAVRVNQPIEELLSAWASIRVIGLGLTEVRQMATRRALEAACAPGPS